ncbi:uncharacterized protein V1510DRAFT_409969 [Dipodascopsis tothii]|uniref:uncharacterized protein n=1 Tax=Dipodascopsis tothii TaxID=44089 RepID=UPI0034CD5045
MGFFPLVILLLSLVPHLAAVPSGVVPEAALVMSPHQTQAQVAALCVCAVLASSLVSLRPREKPPGRQRSLPASMSPTPALLPRSRRSLPVLCGPPVGPPSTARGAFRKPHQQVRERASATDPSP